MKTLVRNAVLGALHTKPSPEGMERNGYCFTLLGEKRLDNLIELIRRTKYVKGDFLEAGVWKGGACIMARAILPLDKKVYVADSFNGFPECTDPKDTIDYRVPEFEWCKISLPEVKRNFENFGLTEGVEFIEGFFADTLKSWDKPLSILRVDGDMYSSTMDVLNNCYSSISNGGYVIIDDYAIPPCKQAVTDFRAKHGIENEIIKIDWTGIYWKI